MLEVILNRNPEKEEMKSVDNSPWVRGTAIRASCMRRTEGVETGDRDNRNGGGVTATMAAAWRMRDEFPGWGEDLGRLEHRMAKVVIFQN